MKSKNTSQWSTHKHKTRIQKQKLEIAVKEVKNHKK